MFPQSMSRSEYLPDDWHSDAIRTLEEHILAGFPPDLALDLVLNELVVRAAEATRASSAALALFRGDEMVCRASTGPMAPDLGVPINTRDGLSGACLQTRQPQLSVDTEFDPRVDPVVSRRLGIRSILIVPVFDTSNSSQFSGILEVFSPSPAAFSNNDQKLLEDFAEQCASVRQAAMESSLPKAEWRAERDTDRTTKGLAGGSVLSILDSASDSPADNHSDSLAGHSGVEARVDGSGASALDPAIRDVGSLLSSTSAGSDFGPSEFAVPRSPLVRRPPYETWALVLGALTILAAIGVSFMIGSRIGWLNPSSSRAHISKPSPCAVAGGPGCRVGQSSAGTTSAAPEPSVSARKLPEKTSAKTAKQVPSAPGVKDDLVVYEKGKVIFRLKPASGKAADGARQSADSAGPGGEENAIVEAASTQRIAATQNSRGEQPGSKPAGGVWLAPSDAESRILSRAEPQYPPEALAVHHAGNVVLKVSVAENGAVSDVGIVSGDPVLAQSAVAAVRGWRYRPYRVHDQTAPFQTNVTLSFTLPN